MINYEYLILSK